MEKMGIGEKGGPCTKKENFPSKCQKVGLTTGRTSFGQLINHGYASL